MSHWATAAKIYRANKSFLFETWIRRQLQTTHLIMYVQRRIKDSGAYVQLWGRRMNCRDWSCRWSLQRPPGACPWRSASASSPPPRSPRAPPPRWSSCHLGTWHNIADIKWLTTCCPHHDTSASSASTSISNLQRSCSTTFWPFSWDVKVWGYSGKI